MTGGGGGEGGDGGQKGQTPAKEQEQRTPGYRQWAGCGGLTVGVGGWSRGKPWGKGQDTYPFVHTSLARSCEWDEAQAPGVRGILRWPQDTHPVL